MQKLGAPIQVLDNAKPGDAASLKLLRTVFMKGLSALTVECVTAAEFHSVKPLLYEILSHRYLRHYRLPERPRRRCRSDKFSRR